MSALSTRADSKELPPLDLTTGPKPIELLVGEAERAVWRLVELFGAGLPFDAELAWSSGSGAGASARITVARAARVSVFARSVRISAVNLSDKLNRVGVTVADGFAMTHNQWEHFGNHLSTKPSLVPIPPFAQTVRVDLAEADLSLLATVRVLGGLGSVLAAYPVLRQPHPGIPVGGAALLELSLPVDVAFRAVYHLSL